jgi:Ni/Fe-hydrogenase subunit HybB-like protein
MNDAFGWGIWKTFNVMVLTALGSGAFAIGIAAWVFRRKRLHSLMRMALLTSFLAYACGLLLLGIDAGRPWNFYWIVFPWKWNMHSPLAEVAICMSIYAMIPLAVENIPPVLERLWYFDSRLRPSVERLERLERGLHAYFPWIIAAAYLLPGMHQSSLGALMLLAGERVHPLWQTPWLPVLYLGAATFMSFGCVAGTTMLCCLVWKRSMDPDVLDEAARITSWLIAGWLVLRLLDIIFRGALGTAFHFDRFAAVFWLEMALVSAGGWLLYRSIAEHRLRDMFLGYILSSVGGMVYRFSPTTLAFRPNPESLYFPSTIEILVSLGFISLGIAGFLLVVKRFAILAGHRENPAWPRSPRRVDVHPAILRSLHHCACHGERPRGGRRTEARSAAERAIHPQPHSHQPRPARPHRALLPTLGAGLGRRDADSQGRSIRRLEACGDAFPLDTQFAQRAKSRARPRQRSRRQRTTWHLR